MTTKNWQYFSYSNCYGKFRKDLDDFNFSMSVDENLIV